MARRSKFKVGDKVVLNRRCPGELLSKLRRNRVRTIISVYYDPGKKQCCYYGLGQNHRGPATDDIECYGFRSYMMTFAVKRQVGRPRERRRYRRQKSGVGSIPLVGGVEAPNFNRVG